MPAPVVSGLVSATVKKVLQSHMLTGVSLSPSVLRAQTAHLRLKVP